jgi:hypothetical protein
MNIYTGQKSPVLKLTSNNVNQRLAPRNISIEGEYLGTKLKSTFRCSDGHVWQAKAYSVLHGSGCPECSGNIKWTKEEINNLLWNRGLQMNGEYVNANTVTHFQCEHNHHWDSTPARIIHGGGCPFCCGKAPLSKDRVNVKLFDKGITLVGEYKDTKTKTTFQCSYGHKWEAKPNTVMSISGCPECSSCGGFKPDLPGWEYILDFGHFLKFGVTNNLTRRLGDHKKNGEYKVVHERYHEIGQFALDWENDIKRTHGGRYVTKEQCPDGYTETLPLEKLSVLLSDYTLPGVSGGSSLITIP